MSQSDIPSNKVSRQFWRDIPFDQWSEAQWERLCDGCGKCCLVKLEDEDDGTVYYTSLACPFITLANCRCSVYPQRAKKQPACVVLNPDNLADYAPHLPPTCAYRRVFYVEDLPDWHPLIAGHSRDVDTITTRATMVDTVDESEYEDYVVEWPILDHDQGCSEKS